MALKTCANSISGNSQDITYLLPVIHMTIRDWYDDDEFDEDEAGEASDLGGDDPMAELDSDPQEKIEQHLRESIKDMRVVDLRGKLKERDLKVSGSKKELQDRLVDDLKNDVGEA